jgi:CheY-like chemotaxis protein
MESNPKVLLVEDDLFFAGRLMSVLGKQGYPAERVTTAADAIANISSHRPDVVIVNLASRTFDGIELIRSISSEPDHPRIVAYLSHVKIPDIRDEVLAVGADVICANSTITMRLPGILAEVMSGVSAATDK